MKGVNMNFEKFFKVAVLVLFAMAIFILRLGEQIPILSY